MPLELQLIRASEFVRLDPHNHLNFRESREVLQALALASRKRALDSAVLDLRELPMTPKARFTSAELSVLVETFLEAGFLRHQRLAILYREDIHGGARNFAFLSRLRGLQVRAFDDFEAALNWLSEERGGAGEPAETGTPIPITKRKTEPRKPSTKQTVQLKGHDGQRQN